MDLLIVVVGLASLVAIFVGAFWGGGPSAGGGSAGDSVGASRMSSP